jgi:hypothetical protein
MEGNNSVDLDQRVSSCVPVESSESGPLLRERLLRV